MLTTIVSATDLNETDNNTNNHKTVLITSNQTYNKYIIKNGENGIIKVPTTRIVNITIPDKQKTYTFTNKYLKNNIHNLETTSAFITFDGNKKNVTNNYNSQENGILIYTTNDEIIIKYKNDETQDINIFQTAYNSQIKSYTSNYLPRKNNTLYTENILINTNNKNNTIITFTEGIKYDDLGLKYQLYKQTKQTTNFNTITYTTLTKTYPQINYTYTNEKVTFYNNKLLKTNLTEIIDIKYQTNNQIKKSNENITFKNNKTDLIQTYITTKTIINTTTFNNIIKNYDNSTNSLLIKNGIKAYYLIDNSANVFSDILNLTWNRNTSATILIGIHNQKQYIENLDKNMAIKSTAENQTDRELYELIMQFVIIKSENDILNLSTIDLEKELQNITEINITINGPLRSSPINPIIINDTVNSIDEFMEENSDYNKSGLYELLGFDEEKSVLANLLNLMGIDVNPEFNEFEAEFGNILMTVGFSLLPEGGPLSIGLIVTGGLLSMDGKCCLAQERNLSRYISFGENILLSLSYGKLTYLEEAIIKTGLTVALEKTNQKFTQISDNDLIIKSAMNFVSYNKYGDELTNMFKRISKTKNIETKYSIVVKNILTNKNMNLDKPIIKSSIVSLLISEETGVSLSKYTLSELIKSSIASVDNERNKLICGDQI